MSKKKKLSAVAIGIVCFVVMISGIYAANAKGETGSTIGANIYDKIDEYLQKSAENANVPAMSVNIVNKDEVLFSGNYGECESSDTPFYLGSVSKSFTAVCIMQLVERQKVELTAAISTYLPEAIDGDQITVSQLLNHTSGLGEHQTLGDYKIVNEQGVHSYANVNYSLLGEIIEVVSGKTYSEYVSENIFEPLGLKHTAATHHESIENGLINGYTNYWGIPIKAAHKFPSNKRAWITVPAGYISSSTNDLGKYLQMYLNGGNGILTKESIGTMFNGDTVYVGGEIPYWYGYGWATVKEPLSEPVLRHSGLIETGTSCVFILPEREVGIAIEANVNDYFVTNEMMDSIGWGLVLMLLGSPANEITDSAYVLNHLWIDLIMLIIVIATILPWGFLPRYVHSVKRGKISSEVARLVALHLMLPIFILLFVPVFFATPLWVAKAFVPDVFITVIISSALLFIGGLVKGVILYKHTKYNE